MIQIFKCLTPNNQIYTIL